MNAAMRAPLLREAWRVIARYRDDFPGRCAWNYAIQAGDDGPIKIGVTNNPEIRLKTLQQANAEVLHGLVAWYGPKEWEKYLHETFAGSRLQGEWFQPTPELLEVVRGLGNPWDWLQEEDLA